MGVWDLWGIVEVAGIPESIYRRLEGRQIIEPLGAKITDVNSVEKLDFIIYF
jgi:hypothetical protein